MSFISPLNLFGYWTLNKHYYYYLNSFINDIVDASSLFDLIMHADDTTLISTLKTFGNRKTPINIGNIINTEISKITTWLKSNMLEVNIEKSKFLIFFKHPKIITSFSITINNSRIEQVDHFNFLGLTLLYRIVYKFLGSKQSYFASLINNCIYTNIYIIYTQIYLHI